MHICFIWDYYSLKFNIIFFLLLLLYFFLFLLDLFFFLLSFHLFTLYNWFLSFVNTDAKCKLFAFPFTTSILYIQCDCSSKSLLATIFDCNCKWFLISLNAIDLKNCAAVARLFFLILKFYFKVGKILLLNWYFDSCWLISFRYFFTMIYSLL